MNAVQIIRSCSGILGRDLCSLRVFLKKGTPVNIQHVRNEHAAFVQVTAADTPDAAAIILPYFGFSEQSLLQNRV